MSLPLPDIRSLDERYRSALTSQQIALEWSLSFGLDFGSPRGIAESLMSDCRETDAAYLRLQQARAHFGLPPRCLEAHVHDMAQRDATARVSLLHQAADAFSPAGEDAFSSLWRLR